MVSPRRKKCIRGLTRGCFWAFFGDSLPVRGTGCSLTGFRLVCIKNVFRNIKYLGFLNYLLVTQMPLAVPRRMVTLHLTNHASEPSSVCLLPLIVPEWISKIREAIGFTPMSGSGDGQG